MYKARRAAIYIVSVATLLAALLYGYVTVSVNCYNSMHSEKMTVLKFYETNDGLCVVFLNEKYYIDI